MYYYHNVSPAGSHVIHSLSLAGSRQQVVSYDWLAHVT